MFARESIRFEITSGEGPTGGVFSLEDFRGFIGNERRLESAVEPCVTVECLGGMTGAPGRDGTGGIVEVVLRRSGDLSDSTVASSQSRAGMMREFGVRRDAKEAHSGRRESELAAGH